MDALGVSGVVDLAHVHKLLATGPRDLFRVALAHQCLVGGLHRVHGVSRTTDTSGEIVDTGGTAHFEDQMLTAETEALMRLVEY